MSMVDRWFRRPDAAPVSRWAVVYVTRTFVFIGARSGYRQNYIDPDRYSAHFGVDVSDSVLGKAVLEALGRSRFLDPTWNRKFFAGTTIKANYSAWVDDLIKRYRFKAKKQLFDKMAFVLVTRQKGCLAFQPHRWAKPEYWYDLDEDQDVVIPETKSADAVGAALRQALDRCS